MVGSDSAVGDVLGGIGKEGLIVAGGLAALFLLPPLVLAAALGGLKGGAPSAPAVAPPSATALAEIPPDQLAVMRRVGAETGVPWPVLAAIAKIESYFGQNMATSWAGAIGYGQFLPSSWAAYGRGGDPYDYRDVIPAMARYLLDFGAPGDMRRALYAYNHDWEYVDTVLGYAAAFGTAEAVATPVAADSSGTLTRVLAIATTQLGKPYIWGAVGPNSFDCSGLVLWSFRQAGISAPRTAQQQFDWSRPVPTAALRPGDLVFFERTYVSAERITHVGFYAGNGQMVNASSGFVRLEPLDSPYWRAHFVGGGRPAVGGVGGAPLPLLRGGRP